MHYPRDAALVLGGLSQCQATVLRSRCDALPSHYFDGLNRSDRVRKQAQLNPPHDIAHIQLNSLFVMEPAEYNSRASDSLFKLVEVELARHGVGRAAACGRLCCRSPRHGL
jgi:hypothetical protein